MKETWYKIQKEFLKQKQEEHNKRIDEERRNFLSKYRELYNSEEWRPIEREYSDKNKGSKGLIGYFSEKEFLKVGGNLCIMNNGELKLASRIISNPSDSANDSEKVGEISRVLSLEASRKVLGLDKFLRT